ncbi:MAG: hypothetical protein IJU18_01815, partial [Oscillospiraceae bacterium]|nr:hypothetical protein [Oscillospiraceae bacterium]
MMRTPRFLLGGRLAPLVHDPGGDVGDAQHILVRFGGQSQHEVELHRVVAAGESCVAGAQQLLLRHV